jgi:hypothetical protein
MQRPVTRAPNPDYRDPREYLRNGFFQSGTHTIRPELLSTLAMAMGRELLGRRVPLELLQTLSAETDALARDPKPFEIRKFKFLDVLQRPELKRHPCLLRLLQAGCGAMRHEHDINAFATHLKRIHQLAAFERVLGRAIELERAFESQRVARHQRLLALKKRHPKTIKDFE